MAYNLFKIQRPLLLDGVNVTSALVLSVQSKTWPSFLSSLAKWAQNSNFITTTGLWLDLEGCKYDLLGFIYFGILNTYSDMNNVTCIIA